MSLEEIKVLLINDYNMPVGKKVKMKWKGTLSLIIILMNNKILLKRKKNITIIYINKLICSY